MRRAFGGRWVRAAAVVTTLGAASSLVACSAKEAPPKGQLMLAIQTDMELPKDVDQVELQISVYGNPLFGQKYPVGAGQLLIPATFGVVAGKDPSTPVTIRLIARQRDKAHVLREVVTTVPADRTAMLRLPIQWLCDGSAKETGGSVESSCGKGQTCVSGSCVKNEVDSTTLPPYVRSSVFGGGDDVGDGAGGDTCFDTVACFGQGHAVPVTLEGCSIAKPADGEFTIGLVKPAGTDGICGKDACIVPLNADDEGGWREQDGRILLPQAVCASLESGKARALAVTTACGSKVFATPTCGSWSSVTTNPGTTDAGAPVGVDLGDGGDGSDGDAAVEDAATDTGSVGVCVLGSRQCDGNIPQVCDAKGAWMAVGAPCTYLCSDGACSGECTPGVKECDGQTPRMCDEFGKWQSGEACPNVCVSGACAGSCVPGAKQCSGNVPQTCDADGQWQSTTTCPFACTGAGSCTGTCVPGTKQCSGTTAQTCDATGTWQSTACPNGCTSGECVAQGAPVRAWATWPMPNPASAGLPNPASYAVSQSGETVKDNLTGLTWQRAVDSSSYVWADAKAYCQSLTLDGLTGWRLPSRIELVSLVDWTRSYPAIDDAAFPNTPSGWSWSSSPAAGGSTDAWIVNFGYGNTSASGVTSTYRVRCVR